jgi:hypothetical protein
LKKILAISLLSIFLGANTELHQLWRLPVLLHHFLDHHQDEQDSSFTHFLSDHYSRKPLHDVENHHEHQNLPFKTNDCATAHLSLAFVNPPLYSIAIAPIFQHRKFPAYRHLIYSPALVNKVWQPPQFV